MLWHTWQSSQTRSRRRGENLQLGLPKDELLPRGDDDKNGRSVLHHVKHSLIHILEQMPANRRKKICPATQRQHFRFNSESRNWRLTYWPLPQPPSGTMKMLGSEFSLCSVHDTLLASGGRAGALASCTKSGTPKNNSRSVKFLE